jgi:hypothetical protein
MNDELLSASEKYLDRLFGPGAGSAHSRFLRALKNPGLEEDLHRAHANQANESALSVQEHYLVGMAVLCATRTYGAAQMFAKTLRHLGVPKAKILEAIARLSTWIGPVPAAEAMARIQKAVLREWFPPDEESR